MTSPDRTAPWGAGTVAAALLDRPALADRPALLDEAGMPTTYGALGEAVLSLASGLRDAGLGDGSRIATVAPRGGAGLLAFLAASALAPCCPLNPGMRAEEFRAAFGSMGVTALLVGDVASEAARVADEAGLTVIAFGPDGRADERSRGRGENEAGGSAPAGTALLMQTSGTTSAPKLVPLTHANILAAAGGIVQMFGLGPDDLCLNPMPLHHVHGLVSAAVSSLLAGSAVCCTIGFSPAGFDAALARLDPSWFTSSPAMHQAMREFYAREGRRPGGHRLRFVRSSSAPLPASVIADLETLFSAPLTETYGLTETASMICANPLPPGLRKPGSVGVAVGAELRVVDAEGQDRPVGEPGEVVVRGPSVISGYLGTGVDRAAAFHGDWLRTGDLGLLDPDGYLSIVGRAKELIKRGGLSVYPAEVDDALAAHPGVAEAVAFSVPHPTLGEELVAAVVPGPGDPPGDEALRAFVAGRLSTYKVPALVLVVPALPKNDTGKILRRDMGRHFADRLAPRNEPPAGPLEERLLALWREVLGRQDFGVGDNLLLLGADPLRAGQVAALARERLGARVSPKDLIAAPTVRAQADGIAAREPAA